MIRLNSIEKYTENNRIEAKKAAGGLPHSLWETYSAFANTFGGILLLGVEELPDHTLRVSGITEPERMVEAFWSIVRNRDYVSDNILSPEDVYIWETERKHVIAIEVPRADRRRKPVYLGQDPYRGTYRRCGEGDYHCTPEEVRAMLRDRENGRDERILTDFTVSSLDMESVARYRQKFSQVHPDHEWGDDPDIRFLEKIGAVKPCGERHCPTAAGLLMFGREPEITKEFPGYFLDYREKNENGLTWDDRVISVSEEWSGNLCDFYSCVFDKITTAVTAMLGWDAGNKTPMREAIREALGNAVIHADYDGGNGLVIEKTRDSITITNPGSLRVNPEAALSGEVTDQRNGALAKMFSLVNVGKGKGGGLRSIETIWEQYHLGRPHLREQLNPDMVTLRLTIETDFVDNGRLHKEVIEYLTEHIAEEEEVLARSLCVPRELMKMILRELEACGAAVSESGVYRLKR